jgi:hypothetical protein
MCHKGHLTDSSRLIHTILAHFSTLLHYVIFQSFVTIGHLEIKLLSFLSTFTINFSLSKPDFTKHFASETTYSIAITADDSVTNKFPVLKDGPLEVALLWCTQFDELAQLKNFNASNKFMNVLLLLSGDAKDKWINTRNDVMPNNENPTKAHFHAVLTAIIINYGASDKTAKGYKMFYERPKNKLILNSTILRCNSINLTRTYIRLGKSCKFPLFLCLFVPKLTPELYKTTAFHHVPIPS